MEELRLEDLAENETAGIVEDQRRSLNNSFGSGNSFQSSRGLDSSRIQTRNQLDTLVSIWNQFKIQDESGEGMNGHSFYNLQ